MYTLPDPLFTLRRPPDWSGLILGVPHSGRAWPDDAKTELDETTRRSSEDPWLDRIALAIPRAAVLIAHLPRALIDLNRGPSELDPQLIDGAPGRATGMRVQVGLGVIPRVVANRRPLWPSGHRISVQEAHALIEAGWAPYHRALSALMDEARREFGEALLIDLHSMPGEAVAAMPNRPEVVIGNLHTKAASGRITSQVESALMQAGFTTRCNFPFAGAYVLEAHGRPSHRRHAIQIEFDRSHHLAPDGLSPGPGWDEFFDCAVQALSLVTCERMRMAAE